MRTLVYAPAIALFLACSAAEAQSDDSPPRNYSLLRENEDWSFLQNPMYRQDFWDPIKYVPLGRDDWCLTVGGEIREAFERVGNDNWGKQPHWNTFLLQRYMFHTDWHLGKHFRVFMQLKSGLEDSRRGGPRPIDEKKLDFEAAYFEIGATGKKQWIVLRAGRQELNYGSGRLVTGYSFPDVPLKPRLRVKSDISSGDNPRTNTLGTFNPLFPIGNYFGVLADTGPGPVNFIDVHPRAQLQLPHSVSLSADFIAQWRENVDDGVYAVPGFLLVAANGSRAQFVGYRPGVETRWQIDRHAYVQADYRVFYAGQFLKEASAGRNIKHMEFWAGYKF